MTRVLTVDLLDHYNQALMRAGFSVSPCAWLPLAVKLLNRIPQPDVLLVGHAVSESQREKLLQHVRQSSPTTRVIFLSAKDANHAIAADGIVSANATPSDLVSAVRNLINSVIDSQSASATEKYSPSRIEPQSVKVLYVAANEGVARLRTNQLKRAGYGAAGAVTLQEIELAWVKDCFDFVIVSPAIGPRLKAMIAGVARQHSTSVLLLESGATTAEITGAYAVTGDSGEDLIAAIRQLALQRPARCEHSGRPLLQRKEVKAP